MGCTSSSDRDAIEPGQLSKRSSHDSIKLVFVLGGPGTGKSTQCRRLVDEFGMRFISAGDLLREARDDANNALSAQINDAMREGKLVSSEIIANLIHSAIQRYADLGDRDFLLDGRENLDAWNKLMGEKPMQPRLVVPFTLFFDADEQVMEGRLLERAKESGRVDDNIETIRKRFATYREQSVPTVEFLRESATVHTINAEPSPDEIYEQVRQLFQLTFAFIKPDVVAAGKDEVMLQSIRERGFDVVAQKKITLPRATAEEFYAEHKERDFFPNLIEFMTSGPAVALVLRKPDCIKEWRAALGPTNTQRAVEEAPDSLRAKFGTDGTRNGGHGSDSPESVAREIGLVFPEGTSTLVQTTFAFIKPDVVEAGRAEEMLADIVDRGFEVVERKEQTLSKELAGEFYAEHKEREFYAGLVDFMTSGPSIALKLRKANAIKAWRAAIGPTDSERAREEAPGSLRAKFGTDARHNAAHGSDSPDSAARELALVFGA